MTPEGRERKSFVTTTSQQQQYSYNNFPGFFPGSFRYPGLPEIGRKLFPFAKPRKNFDRAILKNGDCNIRHTHIARLGIRYLHDIFTSLVDIQWRWTLMIFALAYFVSWLFFALIWWLIMFTHGDLEDEHLPQNQAESEWTPCVLNIHNFTSCYLFSLETQFTIGYGVRTTTEECPQAIFMMSMQAIIGMTIDAFFIGIVFAKMTRPKFRTQTLLFSRNAVVSRQDGDLCLMFRVGDMRKNPLIGASVRAQLLKPKKTKEGEVIKNYRTELNLSVDGGDNTLFLIWPLTVIHRIDEESPLYKFSATDLLRGNLEIMIILEGTVESTGQSIQARSSYLGNEILWGYKFEPVVDHLRYDDAYDVNYSRFDSVYPVETPLCSASELTGFERTREVPENAKPESSPDSFDSDDDDDQDVRRPPPPPTARPPPPAARPPPPPPPHSAAKPPAPPPVARSRSLSRSGRGYEGYDDRPLLEFTSSYV